MTDHEFQQVQRQTRRNQQITAAFIVVTNLALVATVIYSLACTFGGSLQ